MKTFLYIVPVALWFVVGLFVAATITSALASEPAPPSKPAPTCECGACD